MGGGGGGVWQPASFNISMKIIYSLPQEFNSTLGLLTGNWGGGGGVTTTSLGGEYNLKYIQYNTSYKIWWVLQLA